MSTSSAPVSYHRITTSTVVVMRALTDSLDDLQTRGLRPELQATITDDLISYLQSSIALLRDPHDIKSRIWHSHLSVTLLIHAEDAARALTEVKPHLR